MSHYGSRKKEIKTKLTICGNKISKLGLGTFSLRDSTEREFEETIYCFVENGGRFIDTSPFYGDGKIQKLLGKTLENIGIECFISTKIGYFKKSSDYQNTDLIVEQFKRNQEMLRGKINILNIHEADWSYWWNGKVNSNIKYSPIVEMIENLKVNKEVEYFGITGNNAAVLYEISKFIDVDCVIVAKQYDLLWRNACDNLKSYCNEKGIVFITGAPFHQGKLLNPEIAIKEIKDIDKDMIEKFLKLAFLYKKHNLNPAEVCMQFLLMDKHVDYIIAGARKKEELIWLNQLPKLERKLYEEILSLGFVRPACMGIPFNVIND